MVNVVDSYTQVVNMVDSYVQVVNVVDSYIQVVNMVESASGKCGGQLHTSGKYGR